MTAVARRFVVVALVAGTVFVILIPGFTGYDEPYHFLRAWQLSNLQLHSEKFVHPGGRRDLGARFPATLGPSVLAVLGDDLAPRADAACHGPSAACAFRHLNDAAPSGPKTFIGFPSAAVYAPVPYIPSATAIGIGRAGGLSVLASLWLARFAGLLAYVLIATFAIVRMPRWQPVMAVVALLPVCMNQAAMVSADGVTIALAFLAIALAMRLATADPGLPPTRALVEVGALGIALGLSKPPYILFLLLFVPAIVRHRRELLGRLLPVAFLPGVALFAWWSAYAQSVWLPPPPNPYAAPGIDNGPAFRNVDETKQLRFVEHHPVHFLGAVVRTVGGTWRSLLHDAVAQVPAWSGSAAVAVTIALLAYAALVAAVLTSNRPAGDKAGATRVEVAVYAIVAVGTFFVLFLLAYTGWNAVEATRIGAFQGRYLVPVLGLVVVGIAPHLPLRAAPGGRTAALATWAPWLLAVSALALTIAAVSWHYY